MPKPMSIAHRGVHDRYPENSMPAILRAIELGADGIEIDVHVTADDILLVHHDPIVADGRLIAGLPASEVAAIELAPGVTIPLLSDVLDAVAGRAMLFIETKVERVEMLLLRAITEARAECAVHSFHGDTVANLKRFYPALRTGILTSGGAEAAIELLRSTRADDLWHAAADVETDLVSRAHKLGKRVIAWTANSNEEWRCLNECGVDGICTDRLAELRAVPW